MQLSLIFHNFVCIDGRCMDVWRTLTVTVSSILYCYYYHILWKQNVQPLSIKPFLPLSRWPGLSQNTWSDAWHHLSHWPCTSSAHFRWSSKHVNRWGSLITSPRFLHGLIVSLSPVSMFPEGYDPNKPEHHHLLLCLLMSSSDLSDQTKDWKTNRRVAELIYREFFSQGDRVSVLIWHQLCAC